MKRIFIVRIPLLFAVSGIFACSNPAKENKAELEPVAAQEENAVQMLPSFTMLDASGNRVDLTSLKGKKIFINLWATWCPPCRREIPSIEKLYAEANKDKAVFVLLSLDEKFETAKDFAASNKLQVPVFYPAESLPPLFNVNAIPATFIFNERGELVKEIRSMDDYYTSEYIDLFK